MHWLYGIGGGSILAPILIALGYSVYEVAPATLAATFLTSIAGIATRSGTGVPRPGELRLRRAGVGLASAHRPVASF